MASTPPSFPPGSLEKKLFGENVRRVDYVQTPELNAFSSGRRPVGICSQCTKRKRVRVCAQVRTLLHLMPISAAILAPLDPLSFERGARQAYALPFTILLHTHLVCAGRE